MSGAKLRKDPGPEYAPSRRASPSPARRRNPSSLRIIASGVVFLTHALTVPTFPEQGSNSRAQTVIRLRGGAAAGCLSVVAQFTDTQSWLVAPIGGGAEGAALRIELEREGISTKFCARREADGVPKAFIFKSNDSGAQTVVNHNPIPDISHEEFFRIIGPLLYSNQDQNAPENTPELPPINWIHFEGRDPATTLENLNALDGWLKEREWREHVVLSVEMGKPGRVGQDALIRAADVIFFSKSYAVSKSFTSPRAFLVSLRTQVPPHALLVCSWGKEGAAILSVPTREYFQSSPFVPDPAEEQQDLTRTSVRTSSAAFSWAAGHGPSASEDTTWEYWDEDRKQQWARDIALANSSLGRENEEEEEALDEAGAEDAFVAGMIFALSRRILPGLPYSPPSTSSPPARGPTRNLSPYDIPAPSPSAHATPLYEGRWRLDECLRFATELAGRRMRRRGNEGLAAAMEKVGWKM